ncbi:hypothetical protein NP603_10500 [Methylomonas sp. SURF-1]|uniref:Uncharacterized protein n=1 Tax=Methylomonas aurea TaxID=2952224 RepID=A0ABT1UH41_9GAMM|nr:hypothetical protein [Methylomonas sp. SURF-1]MCQ8181539.1 hypothetical protein [Methylomonas sp. SURF-1]
MSETLALEVALTILDYAAEGASSATTGRGNYPISMVQASGDTAERPVFGEQSAVTTASPQPRVAGRERQVSDSSGDIPGNRYFYRDLLLGHDNKLKIFVK